MLAVREALDHRAAAAGPGLASSVVASAPQAANTQVAIRALAEQLVCEANAVLPSGPADTDENPDGISLTDECGPGVLAFTLGYQGRVAEVRTDFAGRQAQASLVLPGRPSGPPRRLASEAEVGSLILSLIAG
jgi:hypothetical protein